MRPLIVVVSRRADRNIEAADRRWKENRDTSDAIRDELRWILAEKDPVRLERWHERAILMASVAEVIDEPS